MYNRILIVIAVWTMLMLTIPAAVCADYGDRPPETSDRPAPIFAAMGLAFSAVVLYLFLDEHTRDK